MPNPTCLKDPNKLRLYRCVACLTYSHGPDDKLQIDYHTVNFIGPVRDDRRPQAGRQTRVVLCEDCVRDGYSKLPRVEGRSKQLQDRVDELEKLLAAERKYNDSIEGLSSVKPRRRDLEREAA